MEEQKQHSNHKALKVVLITLILFVGIQLIARFMLTTEVVHNFVKIKIEQLANEQLNGTLQIGAVKGDLWQEILLTDISVKDETELFSADTLYAKYEIWSFLKDMYQINSIKAVGIQTLISEENDTTFNIQHLVKVDKTNSAEEPTDQIKFNIQDIVLNNINAKIFSPSYLPDSVLSLNNLSASASYQQTDEVTFLLNSLSFMIEEGRLPEPIKIKTAASIVGNQITMQELVIETSRSLLKAKASANTVDSTLNMDASTLPFSLKDIEPYLDAKLPEEELEMSLSVSGTFKKMKVNMSVDHKYAPNFELHAGLNISEAPTLTEFGILGSGLDIAGFTNDSIPAKVGDIRVTMSGKLTQDIPNSDIIWGFTFNNVSYEQYNFDRIIGSGTLKNDTLLGHFAIHPQYEEQMNVYPSIYGISTERPSWDVKMDFKNLNVSHWTDASDVATNLNFEFNVEGEGFELSENPWNYTIASNLLYLPKKVRDTLKNRISFTQEQNNRVNDQDIYEYLLKGVVSKNMVSGKGFITLEESRIDFEVAASDIFEGIANYTYYLETKGFDVSEINQLADFPTSLNAKIFGDGTGFDIEDCLINARIGIDSSLVNGSKFDDLNASLTFTKGVLNISEGVLNSDIIEGTFSGRKNVTDETDPENWLKLDMFVKDLQPLATLADLEVLNAVGKIEGQVTQDTSSVLKGNLLLDLEDIKMDSIFIASRISGKADVVMEELRQFDLNLAISSPIISGVTFQDIELIGEGIANSDTLQSSFNIDIVGSERGRLTQGGLIEMNFNDELTEIKFDRFDFITRESKLALQQPFTVKLDGKSISTDTLDLKSNLGAYLQFAVPFADSVEQFGWFKGQNFDFGIIQEVMFGERFFDGVISGQMFVNNNLEATNGNGAFNLTRIKYEGIEADSLDFTFSLQNERLIANGALNWDGEEKIRGNLDVPFVSLNVDDLGDEFYNRPVSGTFSIKPSQLNRFNETLLRFGITNTDGLLSFEGLMSGTAGEPNFEGILEMDDAKLSGIKVDSVRASFQYNNIQGGLEIESEIIAAKQKAAEVKIMYPVEYDFRKFELILPEEQEEITVLAKTENFNIAVFNDFLDKEYLKELRGTLNADLTLSGTTSKMVPSGFVKLTGGQVSVPIAGITLEAIKSDVMFTEKGLNVKELSARSGRGTFNANGNVELEGIIPKTINLNAIANQFRLANTNDYNIVVDLNSTISGNANRPKATGKLTVRNGFVFLQDFGENTIEEIQLEGEEVSSFSPYDSLAIEMEFEIERNFFVRNRNYLDMEIELVGTLDAQKETNGDLSLFGSLEGIDGYVRPLGKLFMLENANFTFSGPIENPELDIRSKYVPPTRQKGESVELFYVIEGTALTPEFTFESNPTMEQSDIVCYTLFGKPCYSLESWQSVFAGGENPSAVDVLTDVLLDEVEALATRELGVDVVQIDNSGSTGSTSIKTGWYINQRTFFAIINEISGSTPKTLFTLEYILSENWDLIITQGDDVRRGIDFRYQFDY